MSKVVLAIGWTILLLFIMSVYTGYTTLSDAAATLTATIKHVMGGQVMVPANAYEGGGYVSEGIGGQALQLNLNSLQTALGDHLPVAWRGSRVTSGANNTLLWRLPAATEQGYGLTGPVTIAAISETSQPFPTLLTTVAIPVAVHTLMGTWTGTIHRAIVLPLAGQTGPGTFVRYTP